MTTYQSKYPELSFYIGNTEHKFSAGIYVAHTDDEIEVLNRLMDAVAVDDPEVKEDETTSETPKRPRKPKASEAI